MAKEKEIAKIYLEEAKNRSDPQAPCKVHPITLSLLVEAGGEVVFQNKPFIDPNTKQFSGYRSEVKYGEIIFYCERKSKITLIDQSS